MVIFSIESRGSHAVNETSNNSRIEAISLVDKVSIQIQAPIENGQTARIILTKESAKNFAKMLEGVLQ